MAKIAISLSDDILEAVEHERKVRGESRSEFVRNALEMFLHAQREREDVQRYVRGYEAHPESEDTEDWIATAREAFNANPWEGDKA